MPHLHQNEDKKVKILLTGGHAATTGIATIEAIKEKKPDAEIYWIGAKQAIAGSKFTTLEHKIYPSMGVKYFSIRSGKLQTKFTRYTIPLALMIPFGFFDALILIRKVKPKVIVSFGGAASFPVTFWGYLLNIPVIIHEQTVAAGRASLASARFASKIALARIESGKYFPSSKVIITGNPLTKGILSVKPKKELGSQKTILVVGGSRGSEFINEEFVKIVPKLSEKYKIIHVTGERDFEKYKNLQNDKYKVVAFLDPKDMPSYYEKSDVIIARSGANTVSEILYIKRPVIFIPLPRTFMNEQVKNAEYAEKTGIAKVMLEQEVNPDSLKKAIDETFDNWKNIVKKITNYKNPDIKASEKLADLVMECL